MTVSHLGLYIWGCVCVSINYIQHLKSLLTKDTREPNSATVWRKCKIKFSNVFLIGFKNLIFGAPCRATNPNSFVQKNSVAAHSIILWCFGEVVICSIIRCHICQMTGIEYHWSKCDFATILERKPKTWECNKKYNIYEFVINLGSGNGERTNLFTADTEKKNCPTPKTIFFHPSFFIFLLETVWCLLQSTIKGFQLLVFRRE